MDKYLELEKTYEDTVTRQRLVDQYCEETGKLQDEHIASLRDIETLYEGIVNMRDRIEDSAGKIREDQRNVLANNLNLLVKRFDTLQGTLNSGESSIDLFSKEKGGLYQEFMTNKEKTLKLLAEFKDLNRNLAETKLTLDCEVANNGKLIRETTMISQKMNDMHKAQKRFTNRVLNASKECESARKNNERLELLKGEREEEIRGICQTELRVKAERVVHPQVSPVSIQTTRRKLPLSWPSPTKSFPSSPEVELQQDKRKVIHSAQYENRILSTRYVPLLLFCNVVALLLLHIYSAYK